MRIGDVIEIGTRTIPVYVPPKPDAVPPAPVPQRAPAPAKPEAAVKSISHLRPLMPWQSGRGYSRLSRRCLVRSRPSRVAEIAQTGRHPTSSFSLRE